MAKCGACGGRHETAAQVRECYADLEAEAAQARAEQEAERALERKLEDSGWEEAYRERIWEQERGVVDFADAMAEAEETRLVQEREREEDRVAYQGKMERDDALAREVAHKEAEELLAESGGTASVREMMEELDAIARSHGIVWSGAERAAYDTAVRTRYAQPGQKCGTGVVRHVSPKQVAYIERLMRERDTTNLVRLPGSEDFRHMSLKGARDLIDRLLGCPELPEEVRAPRPATDGQKRYVVSLASQKGMAITEADAERMTFEQARTAIEGMKALADAPRESKPEEATPDVPEGSYAIDVDGVMKFYRVDRPTEGRWAGYVFLSAQASDEHHPIKQLATKRAILALIAKEPQAAMERYGIELGACGRCGRTLTSDWRKRGIGPDCYGKLGWR